MSIKVKCPTCGRMTEYSPDNPWRPFCSERCKIIDLGAWASDEYVIPGKPIEADDELQISEEAMKAASDQIKNKDQ